MSRFERFQKLFHVEKPIIGVVHLLALPGSPRYDGDMDILIRRAISDALALEEGGVDGLILENFGDKPFRREGVGPETISSMTLILKQVLDSVSIPVGVNVLRSDCISAMAIATVTGARFIRCNVYTDTLITDQGLMQPCAWDVLSYRRQLNSDVMIFADVLSKHAKPLVPMNIGEAARSAAYRGMADVLIVTGTETGKSPRPEEVETTKKAVPDVPILIGSGFNPENAEKLLKWADGAIVGTYLKEGGFVENKVDKERVKRLMQVVRSLR